MFFGGALMMALYLVPLIFLLVIAIYLIKYLRVKIRLTEKQIEVMDNGGKL